jgi:hypothetical protein
MKEEHFTNGLKTKVWNSLIYSKDSISQKISDIDNPIRYISIIPNALDKENIQREFKLIDYIVNDDFTEEDILDIDLFISINEELYFTNIDDLLLHLEEKRIDNSLFEPSWKINAPI